MRATAGFLLTVMLSQYPNVLLVHPSLPVKNVKELVALAKAKPGEMAQWARVIKQAGIKPE